jgi:hypothetical protein
MLNVEEGINNYEVSTITTLCSEYIIILQITPKFPNVHLEIHPLDTFGGLL